MTLNFLSVYDYLSFILPGGTIIAATWYAYVWPRYQEPGVFFSIVLVVAAFVVGHAVAAIHNWLEPVLWGHKPGSRMDRTWGLFGEHGVYPESHRSEVERVFATRYGNRSFQTNYDLGYAEIQQSGKSDLLLIFNQQIGFYGSMAVSCFIAAGIIVSAPLVGRTIPQWQVWVAVTALTGVLFIVRYKRFWKRFGDQVVRQVRILASAPPSSMSHPAPQESASSHAQSRPDTDSSPMRDS